MFSYSVSRSVQNLDKRPHKSHCTYIPIRCWFIFFSFCFDASLIARRMDAMWHFNCIWGVCWREIGKEKPKLLIVHRWNDCFTLQVGSAEDHRSFEYAVTYVIRPWCICRLSTALESINRNYMFPTCIIKRCGCAQMHIEYTVGQQTWILFDFIFIKHSISWIICEAFTCWHSVVACWRFHSKMH